MTTQRKADSRAESLGQIADLRARVLALMPVRDAAVSVAILLARGIHPHPGILDRLQAALRASHWTVRNPLQPAAISHDPAQAHPRKVPPRERRADRSTGAAQGLSTSRSRRCSRRRLHSADTTDGRPRLQQLWFLAARGCDGAMKFLVSTSSGKDPALPGLRTETMATKFGPEKIHTIEIGSLEALVKLSEENPIIITTHSGSARSYGLRELEALPELEVYDDYRE